MPGGSSVLAPAAGGSIGGALLAALAGAYQRPLCAVLDSLQLDSVPLSDLIVELGARIPPVTLALIIIVLGGFLLVLLVGFLCGIYVGVCWERRSHRDIRRDYPSSAVVDSRKGLAGYRLS